MAKDLSYILKNIPGFLSNREAAFLYDVVYKTGGTIIEIGSLHGRSTVVLAEALKDSGKAGVIYAIDSGYMDSKSLANFKENLNKYDVGRFIEPIIANSEEANRGWNKQIDLLWIDGDHSYEWAQKDYLLWEPYLKMGGIIAYHDAVFNHPDVRKVVSRYIFKSKKFRQAGFIDNIAFATKCGANSFSDRMANIYNLFLKNLVTSSIYIKPPRFIKELIKPLMRRFARSKYK